MTKLQTVFFGSGPVALENALAIRDDFDFEAIITKPSTKGDMEVAFPDTPVLCVSNKAELDALLQQRMFSSAFAILIDFGIIVSQFVINSFPKGIINSHFSLLPEWRGADPITFSILSGQKQTGVSLMLLSAGMDEGPLLAQASYEIQSDETATTLTDRLIGVSESLLHEITPKYVNGTLTPYHQDESVFLREHKVSYSRKLVKEDGRIDWTKPATTLEREIRAYIEWPRSYTTLGGRDVTVVRATVSYEQGLPGKVAIRSNGLLVYCGTDALNIQQLKPAGKKEMDAAAFIAGYGRLLRDSAP